MGENNTGHYDLPSLLRIDGMDIRTVAKNNVSLEVGEYFRFITKFLNRAPTVIETLTKIASHKAKEYDYRSLVETRNLLESLGNGKYETAIAGIINAGRRGHDSFAADNTKEILNDFIAFVDDVSAAKKTEEHETLPYIL